MTSKSPSPQHNSGSMQKILVARRKYNKLVANEMLEDFALRFTAKRARKWSAGWIANTALGTVSFLVLEALGGAITLNYGVINALWAILAVVLVVIVSGLPISYYAAKHGVDIDLLSRGAGFGYIGSTIVSLIYASFTFIFFALEAAIMSMALQLLLGIPLSIGYVISAVVVIPLVMHGITNISRFQVWTQPIWLLMQLIPLFYVFTHSSVQVDEWLAFGGLSNASENNFDLLMFGAASAVLLALLAQIGEQVDFLRFLPEPNSMNKAKWWAALIIGGPGWVIFGAAKLILGSYLAYLALKHGVAPALADDPAHMYQIVFGYVTDNPRVSVLLAAVFVIVSQLKINVANAYAGSLAWSNFFSRITHSHPGRVVWMVFNVAIALLLMELGVYHTLEQMLQIYSVLVLAWIGSVVADLIINKPLGLSPKTIEFKRSQLHDINPVGVGSMLIASVVGFLAHFECFGPVAKALGSYIAFALPFVTVPLIAVLTQSRYYLVREPESIPSDSALCSICEMTFEREDMSWCPAYAAPICSLCCSLDVRCNDKCRPKATFAAQMKSWFSPVLSPLWMNRLSSSVGQFLAVMLSISAIMALILGLAYRQLPMLSRAHQEGVSLAFIKAFALLLILIGVVSWLFVLARSSGRVAMQEVQSHSRLLAVEIDAHKDTYQALQLAKDSAETANHAKSRYLAGISHELRTPLNVLLGYAQLLSNDSELQPQKREYAQILKRNGEHLSDLLEGLLEISKIEAGRLELQRDEVQIHALLQQLVEMFSMQASRKGLIFNYEPCSHLPEYVAADKQRLRQILINLLNNAVKFTPSGQVTLKVSYRNQVARFTVEDTGVGIAQENHQIIFRPFERVDSGSGGRVAGTGLGLTISSSLADLMGGEINCHSELGKGSQFVLSLMLPHIERPESNAQLTNAKVVGYGGVQKTVLVVDDDPEQRRLMTDILEPIGFNVLAVGGGSEALALIESRRVDIYLLDIAMPEMNGWQLAIRLRQDDIRQPIIMVSANTHEIEKDNLLENYHNDYVTKPVSIELLLGKIGRQLALRWVFEQNKDDSEPQTQLTTRDLIPEQSELLQLKSWAEIGFMSAFSEHLLGLEQSGVAGQEFIDALRKDMKQCDFEKIVIYLDGLIDESSRL
ncbi:hybrid sensor histidine kinase/response regulator [Echinimonas agarilytica]|uniref:histidine kinase n=1 Tax=Echinimonas agarilytica TaxID=1215918 RepID=A0AA41W5T9_9GAMM|nr:ATP-binding protein [Echinimonas agarilytica]MCM2679172.1 ATP-binding protein [Echinimonas agarilytica]